MRRRILIVVGIFLFVLIIPGIITISLYDGKDKKVESSEKNTDGLMIKVYDTEHNEIEEMNLEDYVVGVVAAEMPALYELEALKAQAVAARTYALRRMEDHKGEEQDITDDYTVDQAYLSKEELKEKWGDQFYIYYEKIEQSVQETQGEIMVYDQEPIEAVFHAISAGKTQSAKETWNHDVPYLMSVDSIYDEQSPDYMHQIEVSNEEFIDQLEGAVEDIQLSQENLAQQIQIYERGEAGYVKKVLVGNKILTGDQIREIFGLYSSNFTIVETEDHIIFTTKGYGHGAGMSQYGANSMAKKGESYDIILKHYYKGIQIIHENQLNRE